MKIEIEPLGAGLEIASQDVSLAALSQDAIPTGPVGPQGPPGFAVAEDPLSLDGNTLRFDEPSPSVLSLTPASGHDLNQSNWTPIPWAGVLYSHATYDYDLQASPTQITVTEDGWYRLNAIVAYESVSSSRINVKVRLAVNGSRIEGEAKGAYSRDRENSTEGSEAITRTVKLEAGDTIEVHTRQEASGGTAVIDVDGTVLEADKLTNNRSSVTDADTLAGYDVSAFVLTDVGQLVEPGFAFYDGDALSVSDDVSWDDTLGTQGGLSVNGRIELADGEAITWPDHGHISSAGGDTLTIGNHLRGIKLSEYQADVTLDPQEIFIDVNGNKGIHLRDILGGNDYDPLLDVTRAGVTAHRQLTLIAQEPIFNGNAEEGPLVAKNTSGTTLTYLKANGQQTWRLHKGDGGLAGKIAYATPGGNPAIYIDEGNVTFGPQELKLTPSTTIKPDGSAVAVSGTLDLADGRTATVTNGVITDIS